MITDLGGLQDLRGLRDSGQGPAVEYRVSEELLALTDRACAARLGVGRDAGRLRVGPATCGAALWPGALPGELWRIARLVRALPKEGEGVSIRVVPLHDGGIEPWNMGVEAGRVMHDFGRA